MAPRLAAIATLASVIGLAWLPAAVQAQPLQIQVSARVQARIAPIGALTSQLTPGPRATILRVRNPAGYVRAKRAGTSGAARSQGPATSSSSSAAAAQTAVFGTLSAPGLSAAQEIGAFGQSGDWAPPDSTGAIGPADYVELVNSEIAVYDRSNLTPLGSPLDLATFTGGPSPCDVQVKYDPQSDRWFYVALRCDGTTTANELYVGWSKTSDPSSLSGTSGWCKFTVASTPATSYNDYPKLGLDAGHVIIGANLLDARTPNGSLQTAQILVAPKPPSGTLGGCAAPTFTVFGSIASPLKTPSDNLAFSPEPATVSDGSSSTGYVVAADLDDSTSDQSGSHLMVWHVADSGGSPILVADGDLTVASFAVPANVAQPGSSDTIDSMDGRLTQAVAAADPNAGGAETVWTQHTVSDGTGGAVVRWYELVPSTMTVRQHGTISDSAGFAFNGAIAPTLDGGAVIDYDSGGSTQRVQLKAQSRLGSDPPGTMSTPVTLASSSAIDSDFTCPSQPYGMSQASAACRWGDYAGASVDPANPRVVWGSSQVNGPAGAFIAGFGHQAQWVTETFSRTPNATPAPTTSFTVAPNPVSPGSSVSLDAGGSSDPAGITGYSWNFGDGSSATGKTVSHVYATSGVRTVKLTVTDAGGRTSTITHTVTVDAPPTASFALSPTPATPGSPVGFDASGSTDPNPGGTIAAYDWDFGDGATGTGATPTHTYSAPGRYTATLTVTDDHGQDATTTQTVTVDAPTAAFTAAPNPARPGSPVSFDASRSSDPESTIAGYSWSFGDGGTATGNALSPTVSHVYGRPGTYTVTLTVTNDGHQTAATSHAVTVDPPPSASFRIARNPATVRSPVSFDASGSSHPFGTIANYSWNFGDRITGSGTTASHAYAAPGTYAVTLIVAVSDGQTATTSHDVRVRPPPLLGRLSTPKGQKLLAVLEHGLLVSLSSSEGGSGSFQVTTRIKASHRKATTLTLLRGRAQRLAAGSHRIKLGLIPAAARKLHGKQAVTLNVRVTLADVFGQKLTLSGSVTLKR